MLRSDGSVQCQLPDTATSLVCLLDSTGPYTLFVRDVNGTGTGNFDVTLSLVGACSPVSPTNGILDAPNICVPFMAPFLNTYYGNDVDDPTISCTATRGFHTGWYQLTAPADGDLTVDTDTYFNTILAVWTGTSGSLTEVGCNDDAHGTQARVTVPVTAGSTYIIEIASATLEDVGDMFVSATLATGTPPPVAMDDTAATLIDTPVTIDVLANDTGSGLSIDSVTQGSSGSVVNNGSDVTYTPNSGFTGQDSFDYTISNGSLTDTATVTVTVTACPTVSFVIPDGGGTALIDAINAANDETCFPGPQTITLASNGDYLLMAIDNTSDGNNGLPSITSAITIDGNDATIARDTTSGLDFRLFHVALGGDLTLNAVTVRDGNLPSGSGGAVFNAGTVTINSSTITANNAISGGGLWSSGSAVVT